MEDNRTYYYARVSTTDQNLDRQLEAFYRLGATDRYIITDKASGKDFERPGYASLKSATGLRRGDTLVIKSLDRLGRNKEAIKNSPSIIDSAHIFYSPILPFGRKLVQGGRNMIK